MAGELPPNGEPWWSVPNGWELYGSKTPMRRCGNCKEDITVGHGHSVKRGLCRNCLPVFDDFILKEARRQEQERAAAARASTQLQRPSVANAEPEPPAESRPFGPSMPDFGDMADDADEYDEAEGYR